MSLVLDASVTMAWCFEDEFNRLAERVLGQVADTGAMVPAIWPLEVANVLLAAERGMRLTPTKVESSIDWLETLSITVDLLGREQVFREVVTLARGQDLTVYDASYLELAMRRRLPLATLDRRLQNAAMRVGVQLL